MMTMPLAKKGKHEKIMGRRLEEEMEEAGDDRCQQNLQHSMYVGDALESKHRDELELELELGNYPPRNALVTSTR